MKNVMIRTAFTLIGLSVISPGSYAVEANSPMVYEVQSKSGYNEVDQDIACGFDIAKIQDGRQNRDTFAMNFKESILSVGFDDWIQTAQADLLNETLLPKAEANAQKVSVEPYVTRLYSYAQSMNIHGVMALRVNYVVDGSVVLTERYRGYSAKANWANGIGEYHTSANLSVGEAMKVLTNNLPRVCEKLQQTLGVAAVVATDAALATGN